MVCLNKNPASCEAGGVFCNGDTRDKRVFDA
mgnify:CR=1 FL=1